MNPNAFMYLKNDLFSAFLSPTTYFEQILNDNLQEILWSKQSSTEFNESLQIWTVS